MKKGSVSVDLSGKKIDFLSVIRWHGVGGKKSDTEWSCKCACGKNCVKKRSFLTQITQGQKACGDCVDGKTIIGNIFRTFKIIQAANSKIMRIDRGFYIGQCIKCGHKKRISKMMIKNAQESNRKRNLTCPNCLIQSRRGGGLMVGEKKEFLRIISPMGTKGKGDRAKFYWKVECLFNGPDCKQVMEYSSSDFKRNVSCGCKWAKDRRLVNGMSNKNHPYYKIYQLRKNCYDKCHVKGHKNYVAYGARGIYVCDEWRPASGERGRQTLFAFLEWCLQNGWNEGLHLDRIDNDGPYAPWNCQFIPAIENLFYASIDNANETALRVYARYYKLWDSALNLLKTQGEEIQQDFLLLLIRWKVRVEKRTEKLGIKL
jgi:hypothetical protein